MQSIFRTYHICIFMLAATLLSACGNFEKEVEIPMPEFHSQLVVETYIENDKPIKMAVTETQSYFDDLKLPFINDAEVSFTFNNISHTLQLILVPDLVNLKYFNYELKDSFHFQPGDMMYVTVNDRQNRMITAETRWIEPVKIDSAAHAYSPNGERAMVTIYFKDAAAQKNYYRFRVINQSDSNRVVQDIFTNDDIFDGQNAVLGTGFRFEKGDTLNIALYSLTPEFYEFLNTASAAANANGNPFAQPSVIKSNVKGGSGIFTVLPFDRRTYIIP